jgi:membrane protein YqaA with SNARE-associated domain
MPTLESYFLLFIDSFFGGILINPKMEFIFHVMDEFGVHNKFMIFLTVTLAGVFAIMVNYYFGRMIPEIFSNVEEGEIGVRSKPNRDKTKEFFIKYYVLFLLISIWPLGGGFVQLMAGIYNLPLQRVLLICTSCKIAYYGVILIT